MNRYVKLASSFLEEFKKFAVKGNVVDLAVGVIIGAAFGKVVNSLVNDVIMPPLGFIIGGVDFSDLGFQLKEATDNAPAVVVRIGSFINTLIDFTIVAFAIFAAIKVMNSLRGEAPPPPPTDKECAWCLMNIPAKAQKCCHCGSTQERT